MMLRVWFKATDSNGNGGTNCVEAAFTDDGTDLRNSRDKLGPELHFTKAEWAVFVAGAKKGEFDRPAGI